MSAALIRAIREAFPDGPPPQQPITGHRCPECDETDRLIGGRVWSDVADRFPEYCHDTYPLLTPAAKVYYLPAYLSYAVRSPGMMAGTSVQMAMERGDLSPASFTPAQRAAIWAWAEAHYRDEPAGTPPDTLTESWLLGEGSNET